MQGQGSLERDDEDVYFDDESAEVVISSLRLGDDQDSGSLFTNSNWFAFEDNRANNERLTDSLASSSPGNEEPGAVSSSSSENVNTIEDAVTDTATSLQVPEGESKAQEPTIDGSSLDQEAGKAEAGEQTTEWVEWRETSGSSEEAPKQLANPNEAKEEGTLRPPEPSPSASDPPELSSASPDAPGPETTSDLDTVDGAGTPAPSPIPEMQDEIKSSDGQQSSEPLKDGQTTDSVQEEN